MEAILPRSFHLGKEMKLGEGVFKKDDVVKDSRP